METTYHKDSPHASSTAQAQHVLGGTSIEDLGRYIVAHDVRNILVLVGAGASVAAGIPDFRSPNTGLYANLSKYNLDEPSDAFSLDLLRRLPSIFYSIAKELDLWPGAFQPTAVHHFVKLLSDEGRLLRCCTQNIDGLERAAGVPEELLVEAHGSFRTASCIDCHAPYDIARNRQEASEDCVSLCDECSGIVKPDVVFFGEQLPERFFSVLTEDTKVAQMVIIIGTSLQVRPFAVLPLHVGRAVPRVLVNMERVGGRMFAFPDDNERYRAPLPAPSSDTDSESACANETKSGGSSSKQGEDMEGEEEEEERQAGLVDATASSSSLPEAEEGEGDATVNEEESLVSAPAEAEAAARINALLDAKEKEGYDRESSSSSSSSSDGFLEYQEFTAHYTRPETYRDVFFRGDCQTTVKQLAAAMGWEDKLAQAAAASGAANEVSSE